MSPENELFWKLFSDSARVFRNKKIALRDLNQHFDKERSEKTFLSKNISLIEEERNRVFNLYRDNHCNWKKNFLTSVMEEPENIRKYLQPVIEGDVDVFLEEREILESAFRFNKLFVQFLVGDDLLKQQQILESIKEVNVAFYEDVVLMLKK